DCEMHPKPVQKPRPFLVCAGISDVGLHFSASEADACFIGGRNEEEIAATSRRAKNIAVEEGRTLKTFCMYTIVPGATDAEAQARADRYIEGVDIEAVQGMMRSYGLLDDGRENAMVARSKGAFMSSKLVGSTDTIARQIISTIRGAQLDGM